MDAVAAFDLTKEYEGRTALTGLNLQVPQGEAFACVGGAGLRKDNADSPAVRTGKAHQRRVYRSGVVPGA